MASWTCSFSTSADRKSTRLNSSHQIISYAVFCLKKKNHFYYCCYLIFLFLFVFSTFLDYYTVIQIEKEKSKKSRKFFFFYDTPTTEIYTLSLHDALPICSNLWASCYDVDGTDQTSLGQFSGRVQQTYKHSVPRFFVPEHGTMFTLALVRFPPTATKEIQYLNAKGAWTYTDIAGDPVLDGNLPPREISRRYVFRAGYPSKKCNSAE